MIMLSLNIRTPCLSKNSLYPDQTASIWQTQIRHTCPKVKLKSVTQLTGYSSM